MMNGISFLYLLFPFIFTLIYIVVNDIMYYAVRTPRQTSLLADGTLLLKINYLSTEFIIEKWGGVPSYQMTQHQASWNIITVGS